MDTQLAMQSKGPTNGEGFLAHLGGRERVGLRTLVVLVLRGVGTLHPGLREAISKLSIALIRVSGPTLQTNQKVSSGRSLLINLYLSLLLSRV